MLVFSRRVGGRMEIGPGVTVVVTAVHGDQVRLGFECPNHVPIRQPEASRKSDRTRRPDGRLAAVA